MLNSSVLNVEVLVTIDLTIFYFSSPFGENLQAVHLRVMATAIES